jgi:hypothetical protein
MSNILLEKWLVLMGILAWKLGIVVDDFCLQPEPSIPTQYDPHRPEHVFRTINHHYLDISGHDGMDEQDLVGEMAGADGDFGLEVGLTVADFCLQPKPYSNSA